MPVDDLDPHADVRTPEAARHDGRDGDDEDNAADDDQRTWTVAPTLVARPASSITLKTRL
jgi:hypothetical protein